MKNSTSRIVALIAACTLSLASFVSTAAPCKSGQKPVSKGSTVCAAVSTAKASTKAKSASKAKATATKSAAKTKTKAAAKAKSKSRNTAAARTTARSRTQAMTVTPGAIRSVPVTPNPYLASDLPASTAMVDCDSTQIYQQGGTAQCAAAAASSGSAAPAQPSANPGTACFAALAASQASRRLAPRIPFLSASAASSDVLANTSVPSASDRKVLGSVIAGYGMCLDMAAEWRKQAYAPVVGSALDAYWHDIQGILKELAGGKRSYGDAARAIADNDNAYKIRIGTLERVADLPAPNAASVP